MSEKVIYFENEEQAKKYEKQRKIKLTLIYTFLVLFALFTLLPFYWMLSTSFKTADEVMLIPSTFFPKEPTFANYVAVFSGANKILLRYMGNTVLVGFFTTIGTVTTTILAAFAFSRLDFKGKNIIFSLLLATMMIPGEMMIITNFTTISNLGWLDSYQALIIPFTASVFYIFFLRQNFLQIPDELYYAAKVDGKSDFKYLLRVMIPIAKPTIITITILSMIGSWNAYIWPRTVNAGNEMKLITDGLMYLFSNEIGGTSDHQIMAAATIVSLPLLLAFICFKKYIMRGVSRAGIKG